VLDEEAGSVHARTAQYQRPHPKLVQLDFGGLYEEVDPPPPPVLTENLDNILKVLVLSHLGHGGGAAELETSSSNTWPQSWQRKSNIGMGEPPFLSRAR